MPIFEYKTTITAKKKKRKRTKWKKSRPTHATTLYSTTCLKHYYEMLANFFRQFLAISFLPVDINDFLDFFPKPQDFWVLLYLEPSYKMPSCNVWKRITKTKFGNLFELFFLSHKICLNSCHDFQSSLPYTILWDEFFPFLFNMNETE